MKRLLDQLTSKSVRRSLRARVTLGIALTLVVILGAYTAFEYFRVRSDLLNQLSTMASYNGQLIEDTLQHAMLTSNFEDVQQILNTVGKNQNFRVVYLLNPGGTIIFAPTGQNTGIRLDNTNPTCLPCHSLPAAKRPGSVVLSAEDGQRVFRSMQPIENSRECSKCHDPQQPLIGLLLTDIYVAPFEASLNADLRENLIWAFAAIIIIILVVNLIMARLVISPLEKVTAALTRFGGGERRLQLAHDRDDEIGQLETDFNRMVQQIEAEEVGNSTLSESLRQQTLRQQELLKRLMDAQEGERKRIARELHDELGQSLTGLALQSERMEQIITTDPDLACEQLTQTRELIGKTTQQMYELILALRPSVLDDLGWAAALRSLARRVLPSDRFAFSLDASRLPGRLPPSVEIALYRIFQEALSNVIKHSQADRVDITLAQQNGFFEGEIRDNGQGFDPKSFDLEAGSHRGLGLLGIQERASQCGGTVEIDSQPGRGTRLLVRIPLEQVEHD